MVGYAYARDFPGEVTRLAVLEAPLPGFGPEGYYGISWHFLFNASKAPIPENILDDDDVESDLSQLYDLSRHPEAVDREAFFRAYADQNGLTQMLRRNTSIGCSANTASCRARLRGRRAAA